MGEDYFRAVRAWLASSSSMPLPRDLTESVWEHGFAEETPESVVELPRPRLSPENG
jgi:hypothetical protein